MLKETDVAENSSQKLSIVDRIWSGLASIKLAVIVFALISLTSIVGTLLEQKGDPEKNLKVVAKFVGTSAAPKAFALLDGLGFTDMYHAWWFIGLLYLFAANIIVCSLERLPNVWKLVRQPIQALSQDRIATMPFRREIMVKGNGDETIAAVESALRKEGFRAVRAESDGVVQFFAEQGRYSRLGVYMTHLSIIIIFVGAIVGMKYGFNAHLNLLEGTTSAVAYFGEGKEIPLGFELRCDDFNVDFYNKSDTPKSFKSRLTVLENGQPVLINGKETHEIEVNRPLRYKGVTFYQSSYGFAPNRDSLFKFLMTGKNGKNEASSLKFGESFTIPGTSVMGTVADFSPAIAVDESNRLFTYAESMNNPAVFVEFSEQGKLKYRQWILKRVPETWVLPDGTVEFQDLWGAQYTGLQVRKDPGVGIVYAGCFIMALGLYIAFFMSHARIWIILRGERGNARLIITGSSSKNRIAFEGKIERLAQALSAKDSA